MHQLIPRFFALSPDIRYVATYVGGDLRLEQRDGIAHASASESDRYEELIVNPTLLTLVRQRGNIDCGGARYVVVRYGSFFELVIPVTGGHVSIGIEATADPIAIEALVRPVLPAR